MNIHFNRKKCIKKGIFLDALVFCLPWVSFSVVSVWARLFAESAFDCLVATERGCSLEPLLEEDFWRGIRQNSVSLAFCLYYSTELVQKSSLGSPKKPHGLLGGVPFTCGGEEVVCGVIVMPQDSHETEAGDLVSTPHHGGFKAFAISHFVISFPFPFVIIV